MSLPLSPFCHKYFITRCFSADNIADAATLLRVFAMLRRHVDTPCHAAIFTMPPSPLYAFRVYAIRAASCAMLMLPATVTRCCYCATVYYCCWRVVIVTLMLMPSHVAAAASRWRWRWRVIASALAAARQVRDEAMMRSRWCYAMIRYASIIAMIRAMRDDVLLR